MPNTFTPSLRPPSDSLTALLRICEMPASSILPGRYSTALQILHMKTWESTIPRSSPPAPTSPGGWARPGGPTRPPSQFRDLLNDFLRVLGPDHPSTLTTRGNLAYMIGQAGHPDQAAAQYRDLLDD